MSRPNPTSPTHRGSSVRSGFTPGPSKAPKASFSASDATTGHLGQPTEPPADFHPHPLPYGSHASSVSPPRHPQPVPAQGGRVPASYEYQPPVDVGAAYAAPGIAQGYGDPYTRLMQLLMGGLG